MVSLKDRNDYLGRIKQSEKAHLFYDFLFLESILKTNDGVVEEPSDKLFFEFLLSLQTNNGELFNKNYLEISKRKPSPESPFVNDDFLTFCLILGVKRFNIDSTWVQSVINCRTSQNEETNETIQTYKNILKDNYKSKDNNFGIIIVFQNVLLKEFLSGIEKSEFYNKTIKLDYPMYKSDFLNLISLKAFDLVLGEQIISASSNTNIMTDKLSKFSRRVKSISIGIYSTIYVLIFAAVIWASTNDKIGNLIQNAEAIFGFLGFAGILGNFFQRKKVINFINSIITKYFLG